MKTRKATLADFKAFYGKAPERTVRAIAVVDDEDKPLGIGGYFVTDGGAVAFSDIGKLSKKQTVKAAMEMVKFLKPLKMDIVANTGQYGDTALRHYGFQQVGDVWRLEQ